LYDQLIAEWIVKGRQNATECENAAVDLTVNQLISRFWTHA
jgi:hypothetical protein